MKIFLTSIYILDYTGKYDYPDNKSFNVYSTYERAKENGIDELKYLITEFEYFFDINFFNLVKKEELAYEFSITQIDDLEYAENFELSDRMDIGKLESTHKIHFLDYEGNIKSIYMEYVNKNQFRGNTPHFLYYPEDLLEGAGKKFNLGDIVKINYEELGKQDEWKLNNDNAELYAVKCLPKRKDDDKYFNNVYSLMPVYNSNEDTGERLLNCPEKFIEKYNGIIDEHSEIAILSKKIKGERK